ncbi:hypothetical protein [Methanobrevibacter sp.]
MIRKIFLIMLILVFTVGFVSAADETNDNLTVTEADVNTFDDIQVDVNDAKENDVIELEGYYESSGKQITVSKSLTFSGSNNTVLDAKRTSDIFYAPKPVSLTFKNIAFLNSDNFAIGTNPDFGEFNVHIINCTFKNHNYLAISTYGANLKVENSVFEDNYQAIQEYTYPMVITNSTFIRNDYVAIQAGDATISNSTFMENGNKKDGIGALYCCNLKLNDSKFINNFAYEFGGAIYTYGSISISNSSFTRNSARYLGGAIYVETNNNLILNECIFNENSAYNGAAIYSLKSPIDISNSNFTKNNAKYSIIYSKAKANFNNITFKDNSVYTIIASKVNIVNCNNISKTINQWACLDDNLNNSTFIRIVSNNIYTYYGSGKKLTVKLINNKDNSAVGNCKVKVVLKTGKKTYTKILTTDSRGIASFDISKFNSDVYIMRISVADSNLAELSVEEIDTVLIYEASPKVKAPKVKFKYKKSKYFKVTVKHQKTKKAIKKLKLKLKVYTGKKYKVYKIKTNNKGVAKLNTKKLKRGKHKVVITSLNKNYIIIKKSTITIR